MLFSVVIHCWLRSHVRLGCAMWMLGVSDLRYSRFSWKDTQPVLVGNGQLWVWSGSTYHPNTHNWVRGFHFPVSLITVLKTWKRHQGDLQRMVSAPNTLFLMNQKRFSYHDGSITNFSCWQGWRWRQVLVDTAGRTHICIDTSTLPVLPIHAEQHKMVWEAHQVLTHRGHDFCLLSTGFTAPL